MSSFRATVFGAGSPHDARIASLCDVLYSGTDDERAALWATSQPADKSKELDLHRQEPRLSSLSLPLHVDESTLEILSINTNDLTGISSAELQNLGNLRQLKAGCNRIGIRGLPSDFGLLLPNLTQLFLHSNRVKTLPKSIGRLTHLKILDVHNNQIESFPDEMCNLPKLERILAGGNELKALPEAIGRLGGTLVMLTLRGNTLKRLPTSIGQLINVERLYLSHNPDLEDVPEEMLKDAGYYKDAAQRIITRIRELRATSGNSGDNTREGTGAAGGQGVGVTLAPTAVTPITVVPSAAALQETVFSATLRRTPDTLHNGCSIGKVRAFYMRKIKFTDADFTDRLQTIESQFAAAAGITGGERIATAVALVGTCSRIINAIAIDCVKLLWIAGSAEKCRALKRAGYGQMCIACTKLRPSLEFLEAVRPHLDAVLVGQTGPSPFEGVRSTLDAGLALLPPSATTATVHAGGLSSEGNLVVDDWQYTIITDADAVFDVEITARLDALEGDASYYE